MKTIILAAGYATRLYPLTKDMPKPLLEIGGQTILDRLLQQVAAVAEIDQVFLVTNSRFYGHFKRWQKSITLPKPLELIADGSTESHNRLGALADLQLVIEQRQVSEDCLVLGGDNLFDLSLHALVDFFHKKGTDVIACHRETDVDQLRTTGVVRLDADGRVVGFQEKPAHPDSSWAVPPVYVYKKDTLRLVEEYLAAGENPDAPGYFLPWLIERRPVHALPFAGRLIDIGTVASLERARALYAE